MVVGLRLIKRLILGWNRLECYGKGMATNKQYKINQMNSYYCSKKDA